MYQTMEKILLRRFGKAGADAAGGGAGRLQSDVWRWGRIEGPIIKMPRDGQISSTLQTSFFLPIWVPLRGTSHLFMVVIYYHKPTGLSSLQAFLKKFKK
jgi:hypothetical protein